MNTWVPQSYEAVAELMEICSTEANFTTAQHSRPIIAMKQDAMTGGYLLTYGDVKIDKATFFDCLMIEMGIDVMEKYEHIRNVYKWKGVEQKVIDKLNEERKEILKKIEMLSEKKDIYLSKVKNAKEEDKKRCQYNYDVVCSNLKEARDRLKELRDNFDLVLEEELMYNGRTLFSFVLPDDFEYTYQNNMDIKGEPVYITRGVLMSGTLNKSVMGSASGSISHMLRLNYSARRAIEFVSYYQMIINRWLLTRGFSVGIEDCIPKNTEFVQSEANKCFSQALLHMQTEEDDDLKEMKVNNSLNNARDVGQRIAKESLSPYNSFVAMIRSGAKGNDNNITQITSMLGQQNMEGQRMRQVFGGRALPHFKKNLDTFVSETESSTKMLKKLFGSRGFVHSGFYKGLEPHEMFFHAVGGREGLIDTACKTAQTGYIQRKMVKLLEDLQVTYSGTVEDASKHIISFDYGGDNFDGSKIIYRNGEPLFMDVESIVNKLNADHEWEKYEKKDKPKIEVLDEELVDMTKVMAKMEIKCDNTYTKEDEAVDKLTDIFNKKMKLEEKKEVQQHGFLWEKDLMLNVYKVSPKDMDKIKYTEKYDIPSRYNVLDGSNLSIKTSGKLNSVCMADCLRLFDEVEGKEPFHLTVVFYDQDDDNNTKILNSIVEVDLTNSREILFGKITRKQIQDLDKMIKRIPQKRKPTDEEYEEMYELKDKLQKIGGSIRLDIKCNSQQSRLQCSFNKFQDFIKKHPERVVYKSNDNNFRGGKIQIEINSGRREFRK